MDNEISVYALPGRGYRNWKKAMAIYGFKKHVGQQSSKHHAAHLEFKDRQAGQQDVLCALREQTTTQRLQNRARLTFILDICLILAKQEIASRGNDENVCDEEYYYNQRAIALTFFWVTGHVC
jgi:hypothetical protein